ncbi:MAG: carbohydrate kinase family protein [Chitinophagaceae bacterium]
MQQLLTHLAGKIQTTATTVATLGFDGFIDSIVKLVRQKGIAGKPSTYFNQMSDWGSYVLQKKGSNFSNELQQSTIKAGGNMPNMAGALASLGITVNCVGAMGYPVIDPLFSQLHTNCQLYSYAPAGRCQSIEFDDGKMMLYSMDELNNASWPLLKERVPIATLIKIIEDARLIGLLNWAELPASTGFWKGMLQDVLPFCKSRDKFFFADLSDCSIRSKAETRAALDLLADFATYGKVILGANHNESICIHNCLFEPITDYKDINLFAKKIFDGLNIDTLLLHNRATAVAVRRHDHAQQNSLLVESPALLTGAGDNFNAGFCFAQLMDCSLADSLVIAHLVAAQYIKNGCSSSCDALLDALKTI